MVALFHIGLTPYVDVTGHQQRLIDSAGRGDFSFIETTARILGNGPIRCWPKFLAVSDGAHLPNLSCGNFNDGNLHRDIFHDRLCLDGSGRI